MAANVLEHGTGALNIDACRIGDDFQAQQCTSAGGSLRLGGFQLEQLKEAARLGQKCPDGSDARKTLERWRTVAERNADWQPPPPGRWPANVALDETQAETLDQQSGVTVSRRSSGRNGQDGTNATYALNRTRDEPRGHDDKGGASRFYYVAKASNSERPTVNGVSHPTVKPLTLMRWLVRLITPPDGTVLDPFTGSGTTLEAAWLEGFNAIGVEASADYCKLVEERMRKHGITLETR